MPVELTRRNFRQYDRDDGQSGILAPNDPGVSAGSLTAVTTNAYFSRFVPSRSMTIVNIAFAVTTAASVDDPCDVGIYTVSGANLTRVVSAGATSGKLNAGGRQSIAITATTLAAGTVYYAGISFGTIGGTAAVVGGANLGGSAQNTLLGTALPSIVGVAKAASHPLPASVVSPAVTTISARLALMEV